MWLSNQLQDNKKPICLVNPLFMLTRGTTLDRRDSVLGRVGIAAQDGVFQQGSKTQNHCDGPGPGRQAALRLGKRQINLVISSW